MKAVQAKELASLLSVSERHVWRLNAQRKLPRAVSVGRCVRWLLDDIERWLKMGCPARAAFEHRMAAVRKREVCSGG